MPDNDARIEEIKQALAEREAPEAEVKWQAHRRIERNALEWLKFQQAEIEWLKSDHKAYRETAEEINLAYLDQLKLLQQSREENERLRKETVTRELFDVQTDELRRLRGELEQVKAERDELLAEIMKVPERGESQNEQG